MTTTTTTLSPRRLLLAVQPLLQEPEKNAAAILALLQQHDGLVEYEVVRAVVARHAGPLMRALCESEDPMERRSGIGFVRAVADADEAARLLRPLVRDVDMNVRRRALQTVRELLLDDTALPARATPERFDPSGWSHGNVVAPTRPENLSRFSLPVLRNADDVAEFLGVDDLTPLLRPGTGPGAPYVAFTIEKAKGGERKITAPKPPLREAQRKILREILDKVPAHDAAYGFVKGRSVVDNANVHLQAALVVKLDLKDFFPTLHYRRVAGLFRALGYADAAANALAGVTTFRGLDDDNSILWPGLLPQGAPTSPAIANLVCRQLDARLRGLATRVGAVYSRYADDLTFSFAATPLMPLGRFTWWVDQICGQEGFTENTKKRRVLRPQHRQLVTGVVVNRGDVHGARVPRDARHRFRALLFNVKKNGLAAEARGDADLASTLRGFAAWVHMVQPELGRRWLDEVEAILSAEQPK